MFPHERWAPLAAAVLWLLLPVAPTAGVDDNWPQWRGHDRLDVARGSWYAEEWTPEGNIAWHQILRTNSVGEPVWASLASAADTIYIRRDNHPFAVGEKG